METSTKEAIYSWVQFIAGASLAAYTYENPKYEILFYVCSAIAVGGARDYLKIIPRNSSFSFPFESHREWSSWEFASGMCTYLTGVYAFSERFQHKIMRIPCVALVASGYYFATSSINSLDRLLDMRPLLKCCQLMFEPALTAYATAYVFYFRNHSGGWLECLPFIVTAVNGFKLVSRGCVKSGYKYNRELLLPKATEMCVGGCLVCISCAALAIYSATKDFFWPWTSGFLSFWSLFGVSMTFGSLSCFQQHLQVERNLFLSIVGMTVGPLAFSSGWLMVAFVEESTKLHLAFMFLITAGQAILVSSLHRLYRNVSQQVFYTCCQRVFGPILAVDSSILSAYIAYKIGWRFSLWTVPLVPVGIYAAYRGFRKEIRTSRL